MRKWRTQSVRRSPRSAAKSIASSLTRATNREQALRDIEREAGERAIAAGASPTARLVDMEEIFLSYLPGNTAQVRAKVVGDLATCHAAAEDRRHSRSKKARSTRRRRPGSRLRIPRFRRRRRSADP
jgi:hypothetical protein